MKTDKTGLEQLIEWDKEQADLHIRFEREGWRAKARSLLATEKSAMEKALEKNPPEPILDKRTALAIVEYETIKARSSVDGMESENRARERQGHAHAWPESCFCEVNEELEKNTTEARAYLAQLSDTPASPEKSTQGQGDKGCDNCSNGKLVDHLGPAIICRKGRGICSTLNAPCPDYNRQSPSPDPQTQVQQLIQWAKDNGYGLAAEWMEERK